ncbi:putative bifunctional diguanylate cyclase/phosphodiesterase [Halomonas daqiaonensis]|uniref:Diguanylate cyclase/phosphodiesterase with GAF sensor n=1 Tax=Halomonas daqiaonensis TaxID=650850 RepID=A0A1H7TF79_9GAMM|nr:EAL domain-containing protein [Halomonas daqiaonensis]SEL83373.1 diguanylate cyclase/phosphodiesterase with GAF sensor [Halomonas daqiaonensis]
MITPVTMNQRLTSIAVLLTNPANAQLLKRILGGQYALRHDLADGVEGSASAGPDLIVVDVVSLRRHRERIRELRRLADPLVLPVLLVNDRRLGTHAPIASELGNTVDDILRIPTSQEELKARIGNLLRLGTLSREQEEARRQLEGLVSALHTLNACDNVVVRAKNEEDLIKTLCRTIVDEEDYNLAWIGFADEDSDKRIQIRASAGPANAFVADLNRDWEQDPQVSTVLEGAMHSGRTHIIDDVPATFASADIRDRARSHRLGSAIILPLNIENGPPGCLAIYASGPEHFGTKQRELLERLADNLVFGLSALRSHFERVQQAAEIHYLAYTDALTGLPNRRHLLHYLEGLLSRPESGEEAGAIIFIDLDGFKLINDALGHDVGDQVLKQIGQRLQGAVRDSDLVVRQGGDEFLVVMFDAPRHSASLDPEALVEASVDMANRIIAHLKEPLMVDGHSHRLSASVGISLFPRHGREPALLIENADKAMYEAKARGGSCSRVFSEEMSASRQQRFSLEARLRQALERDEFELYYQPVFDLDTCRIMAVEALIRWPQEDGSMLMPGSFMPLAEEIGLIKPLGDWVLETAVRQLRAWHDQGFTLAMSVNISVNQLHPHGDVEHFAALVRPHIDPRWVHLEVTESTLMVDPSAIETLLAGLHEEGFQIAIDDFGTGFSSLSRLQHLSIQTLKIDRSFVSELDYPNSKGAALVGIIHKMASNLGLQIVAEGIETEQQRQRLLAISGGKGWGQGFWFSPAISAEELERWLQRQRDG